jgi:hypothetical protein
LDSVKNAEDAVTIEIFLPKRLVLIRWLMLAANRMAGLRRFAQKNLLSVQEYGISPNSSLRVL